MTHRASVCMIEKSAQKGGGEPNATKPLFCGAAAPYALDTTRAGRPIVQIHPTQQNKNFVAFAQYLCYNISKKQLF